MHRFLRVAAAFVLCASAQAGASFELKPSLDVRLRHEHVEDDAFVRDADATTLRARLGLGVVFDPAWSALVEAEHTSHLFGERFNSTANGRTGYPTVPDPDNTELNQAWVRYAPTAATVATLGRQRILLDNQRFFGNVGWRQNEQTFDALDWQQSIGDALRLRYSYLDRVQRIFGVDHPQTTQGRWDLDTHLLSASSQFGIATVSGYAHLIDNDSLPLASHRNLGVRAVFAPPAQATPSWRAVAEFARQRPYAGGAGHQDADYLLLEGSVVLAGNTLHAGWEVLGGDGTYGFATPFATLHAFNGWADRFLATPPDGLRDAWLGWKRTFGKVNAQVAWHDFSADHGDADYGSEWDAALGWGFAPRWNLLFKLARYEADSLGRDASKAWVDLEYRF